MSKSVIGYFKTKKRRRKKVPMAIKLEGGGKALVEELFFAASLKNLRKYETVCNLTNPTPDNECRMGSVAIVDFLWHKEK